MLQLTNSSQIRSSSGAGRGSLSAPRLLVELLEGSGVRFNGDKPWDIQVRLDPTLSHSFGGHVRTRRPELRKRYSQSFYRMWKYYLHSCAASFRSGQSQLWQIVLTRPGARPDFRSWRPASGPASV